MFPCCFKNRNYEILNLIGPEIDERFEILNIFKKLNELDRLKKILFDEDQQLLLSVPHKTIIKLKGERKTSTFVSYNENSSFKDYRKAYAYLKRRTDDDVVRSC